jgi:hypothetical protein
MTTLTEALQNATAKCVDITAVRLKVMGDGGRLNLALSKAELTQRLPLELLSAPLAV